MTDKLIEALSDAVIDVDERTCSCIDCRGTKRDKGKITVLAVLAELDRLGWVCVPKVPTMNMCEIGGEIVDRPTGAERMSAAYDTWLAMIAAAPKLGGE